MVRRRFVMWMAYTLTVCTTLESNATTSKGRVPTATASAYRLLKVGPWVSFYHYFCLCDTTSQWKMINTFIN